jgi:diphthamide biosynthesis methyltransferase
VIPKKFRRRRRLGVLGTSNAALAAAAKEAAITGTDIPNVSISQAAASKFTQRNLSATPRKRVSVPSQKLSVQPIAMRGKS